MSRVTVSIWACDFCTNFTVRHVFRTPAGWTYLPVSNIRRVPQHACTVCTAKGIKDARNS